MTQIGPTVKIVDQIVALDQSLTTTLNQLIATLNQTNASLNQLNATLSTVQTLMGAGLPASMTGSGRLKVNTGQ